MFKSIKAKISTIAMLLLGYSSFSNAQTTLTLQNAIDYALKHKSEALKSRLDIQNAENKIDEVRANVYPHINAQVGLTYNPILQQMALNMGGQTTVIKMGTPWNSNAAVQLDQQLFNMSVFHGLRAAKSTREFYQINANLTEEQVIEKVANSYFEYYKTKSQINTLDKTVKNTTRIRNVIASLEENGLAKKIDLDRTNVALNNLSSNMTQLNNALKLQENALKYLIGMDISTPIELPENTFQVKPNLYVKENFNVENRTEIQLLQKQAELLAQNKKAIVASGYPSLGLSANYGYVSMGDKFPYFAGKEKGINSSDFSGISLNLKIPLFNGFAVRSKARQAQIDIDKQQLDIQDTKLALNLAAENAYTQINNSIMTLNNQKSNMELAEQVLSNVENNYNNGLASLTDLLDAETSYADAQNNYTAAILDYKLAEVQLKKANGELLTTFKQSNK